VTDGASQTEQRDDFNEFRSIFVRVTAFPQGYYPTEGKISRGKNREDLRKRVKSARVHSDIDRRKVTSSASYWLIITRARARGMPSNNFSRECQPQDLILSKPTRGDIEIERITPSPDRSKFH